LRSVADATYFGNTIFAARYVELHSFAAKFSPTVEQTVNERAVEVFAYSPSAGG